MYDKRMSSTRAATEINGRRFFKQYDMFFRYYRGVVKKWGTKKDDITGVNEKSKLSPVSNFLNKKNPAFKFTIWIRGCLLFYAV